MTTPNSTPDEVFSSEGYLNMDLLRFTTAGSVDDGKSTLIGRLLYDSKSIFEDQLEAIEKTSHNKGKDYVDLSLLTDGLRAEREQGITIDVAYRYFATPKRKFIIADTPGHIQYTRNMVTGASTANLAIILVDARKGVIEQTRRHSFIASLLGIKHLVVAINKMDLMDYSEETFESIRKQYLEFSSKIDVPDIRFIPISALNGDNVVNKSENTPWYQGETLLHTLETVQISSDLNYIDARFPVQYVVRPQTHTHHDYRGYAGRIESGIFRVGDKVTVLPSGFSSTIKSVELGGKVLEEAVPPMSVTITLNDEIDISRGDMLVKEPHLPQVTQSIEGMVCWMNQKPLALRSKYVLRHTTLETQAIIESISYKVDISALEHLEDISGLNMNEIGCIKFRTAKPLVSDSYKQNRLTGSFILVDPFTNETVGAGMIL